MIGTSGKSMYKINIGGNQSSPQQSQSQGGWEDVLPGAAGLVGGVLSAEGGLPGALISGTTQAAGAAIKDLLQGGKQTGGFGGSLADVGKNFGEGAAYGAIPGGRLLKEAKYIPEFAKVLRPAAQGLAETGLGRTALRAGTGLVAGTGAQTIANIGSQTPQTPAVGTGAQVGLLNAASPALGAGANLLGKGLQKMSSSATDIAGEFAARSAKPLLENVQSFLGKQAVTTSGGEGKITDFAQKMMKEHGFVLPPHGDPQTLLSTINEAQAKVSGQLTPFLEKFKASSANEVSPIIKRNLEKFFGTTQLGSKFKAIPPEIKYFATQISKLGTTPTLAKLKELQQGVADLVQTSNWSEPKDRADQFAISTYKELDDLIRNRLKGAASAGKLSSEESTLYNDLMRKSQWLVHARQATQHTLGGFTKLPVAAISESIAKGQSQMGFLGPERIKQAALRAALLGGTIGGTALGLPKEVTLPLMALEAASIIPYGGEGIARKMAGGEQALGQALQKPGEKFTRALQQLGVRVPTLGQ